MSFTGGGTRRWMNPELLHPEWFGIPESEDNRPTRQSDCYALGMVIYEVSVRASDPLYRRLIGYNPGPVRTPPLPRDTVGCTGRSCDHGRGTAEETGRSGCETARIQR